MAFYIREENSKLDELAFYGPFEESEVHERLNDAFADSMAHSLASLYVVEMDEAKAALYYINPREFWMEQLAAHTPKDIHA